MNEDLAQFLANAELKIYRQQAGLAAKLRLELYEVSKRFWSLFAASTFGINSPGTPGYVTDSGGSWKELNEKYAERKGHSRFYEKSGDLQEYVSGLNYSQVFGVPKVVQEFEVRGSGGNRAFQDEFEIRGKLVRRWRLLTKDGRRGRFAKKEDIFYQKATGKYRIDEMPELTRRSSDEKVLENAVFNWMEDDGGEGQLSSYKFRNFKGQRQRPAIGPYLLWWRNNVVNKIARKYGDIT